MEITMKYIYFLILAWVLLAGAVGYGLVYLMFFQGYQN